MMSVKVGDIPVSKYYPKERNSQEGLLLSYSDWRNYEKVEFKRCYI